MDRNGDLPKLSGFVTRYKKDVKTFPQYSLPTSDFERFRSLRKLVWAGTVAPRLGTLAPTSRIGSGLELNSPTEPGRPDSSGLQMIHRAAFDLAREIYLMAR
jgi:hypothetical protein